MSWPLSDLASPSLDGGGRGGTNLAPSISTKPLRCAMIWMFGLVTVEAASPTILVFRRTEESCPTELRIFSRFLRFAAFAFSCCAAALASRATLAAFSLSSADCIGVPGMVAGSPPVSTPVPVSGVGVTGLPPTGSTSPSSGAGGSSAFFACTFPADGSITFDMAPIISMIALSLICAIGASDGEGLSAVAFAASAFAFAASAFAFAAVAASAAPLSVGFASAFAFASAATVASAAALASAVALSLFALSALALDVGGDAVSRANMFLTLSAIRSTASRADVSVSSLGDDVILLSTLASFSRSRGDFVFLRTGAEDVLLLVASSSSSSISALSKERFTKDSSFSLISARSRRAAASSASRFAFKTAFSSVLLVVANVGSFSWPPPLPVVVLVDVSSIWANFVTELS